MPQNPYDCAHLLIYFGVAFWIESGRNGIRWLVWIFDFRGLQKKCLFHLCRNFVIFYVIPKADKMSLSGYKRNEPSKNCHEYLRTIHDKIASDFPNKRNLCDISARLHLCASSSLFICRTVAPEICYRLGQIEVRWMRKIFPLGIVLLWHRWLNFLPMLLLLLLWHLFFRLSLSSLNWFPPAKYFCHACNRRSDGSWLWKQWWLWQSID